MITMGLRDTVLPFDPRDPRFIANPYPTYAALRTHRPVWFREDRGDWVITGRDDIARLLRMPELGHPDPQPVHAVPQTGGIAAVVASARRSTGLWFTKRNPPDHGRLRGLIRNSLGPRASLALEPVIRAQVNELLDTVNGGAFDAMAALARPLPASIICHVLGIPEPLRASLMSAMRRAAPATDIDPDPALEREGWFALSMVDVGVRRLLSAVAHDERRPECRPDRGPGEGECFTGLAATLAVARRRGQVDLDEAAAQLALMLFAGHATTEALIGNTLLALMRHPEQLTQLRATPSLIEATIEEVLRTDPPAQVVTRTALAPVGIAGQRIKCGERVMLVIASANHDPGLPFDITRKATSHLAFGAGIHVCPGTRLARLQAQIAVSELVRRAPTLCQTGPEQWAPAFAVRGLAALPMYWGDME